MSFGTRVYNILISSLAILALASCGGDEGKSGKVTFKVNPGKPIVISSDAPRGGKTIRGPWFGFSVTMTNGTTEPVTLIALEVEVTGQSDSGSQIKKGVFTPGANNFSGDSLICDYAYFGTWQPGETRVIGLPHVESGCARDGLIFLSEGNPKMTDREVFNYRVKVKPAGWFGTFDNATDRLSKSFNFSTQ